MSDEGSESGYGGGGYGRSKWPKYVLIYLLVGGAIYALVWFLFLRNGVYGG